MKSSNLFTWIIGTNIILKLEILVHTQFKLLKIPLP